MSFPPKSTEIMSSPHWFSSNPTWVQDLQELKTTAAARGTESLSYTFQVKNLLEASLQRLLVAHML